MINVFISELMLLTAVIEKSKSEPYSRLNCCHLKCKQKLFAIISSQVPINSGIPSKYYANDMIILFGNNQQTVENVMPSLSIYQTLTK